MKKLSKYILGPVLLFGLFLFSKCEKEDFEGLPIDGDGNVYDTVVIGTQTWMAENLKTTKYNDGTEITYFDNAQKWATLPVGGYGWYDSNPVNKDIYGALYNAKAIHVETFCPKGWHVPTTGEWTTLIDYLGGGEVAAKKLREQGDYHWIISGNKEGTNESGFTALPGGEKYAASNFGGIGFYGSWWAFALNGNSDYVVRIDCENNILIYQADTRGWVGYSVRCVKDD